MWESRIRGFVLAGIAAIVLAGCATYPANTPLPQIDPADGYRFTTIPKGNNTESLFVVLTFSGGGTRAAALSYGVMEKLRNTTIEWKGEKKSLLSEVDVISSVSGGSFTSAYYGLFRDRLFADRSDPAGFKNRFLYRNVQRDLALQLANPISWGKLASPTFGRIDLAASLYDDTIFENKTFAELGRQGRPFIMINATDMSKGVPFTFQQERFDYICSDLDTFHVARAVAASSNFPVAFTPLTVNNYADGCALTKPTWIRLAEKDRAFWINPRRFYRARTTWQYRDVEEHPYMHLLDGGVSDNIGLRGPLVALESNDLPWSIPNMINNGKIEKLVVIIVDAKTSPLLTYDRNPSPPNVVSVLETTATVPLDNYSFDTVERLRNLFQGWRQDRRSLWKDRQQVFEPCPPPPDNRMPGGLQPLDLYEFYVGFDQIADEAEREAFLRIKTSFDLPAETVDSLIDVGGRLLENARNFDRFKSCLKSP